MVEITLKPDLVLLDGKFKSWKLDLGDLSEVEKYILGINDDNRSRIDDFVVEQIGDVFYALVPWDEGHQGNGISRIKLSPKEIEILFGIEKPDKMTVKYRLEEAFLTRYDDEGSPLSEEKIFTDGKIIGNPSDLKETIKQHFEVFTKILHEADPICVCADYQFSLEKDFSLSVEVKMNDSQKQFTDFQKKYQGGYHDYDHKEREKQEADEKLLEQCIKGKYKHVLPKKISTIFDYDIPGRATFVQVEASKNIPASGKLVD